MDNVEFVFVLYMCRIRRYDAVQHNQPRLCVCAHAAAHTIIHLYVSIDKLLIASVFAHCIKWISVSSGALRMMRSYERGQYNPTKNQSNWRDFGGLSWKRCLAILFYSDKSLVAQLSRFVVSIRSHLFLWLLPQQSWKLILSWCERFPVFRGDRTADGNSLTKPISIVQTGDGEKEPVWLETHGAIKTKTWKCYIWIGNAPKPNELDGQKNAMACHSLIKQSTWNFKLAWPCFVRSFSFLCLPCVLAISNNEAIKMLAFIFVHSSHLTIIRLLNICV